MSAEAPACHSVLDALPAIVVGTDASGTIQIFNPAAERALGYSADEIIGHRSILELTTTEEVAQIVHSASLELGRPVKPYEALVARLSTRVRQREWTLVRKDGTKFRAIVGLSLMRDAGRVRGFLAVATDISRRVQLELALCEDERRAREALEVARVGIWELNEGRQPDYWSDQMYELFGRAPADGPPGSVDELLSHVIEGHDAFRERVDVLYARRGVLDNAFRVRHEDGEERWLLTRGGAVPDDHGGTRLRGIVMDVTELQRAKAELEESQRRLAEARDRALDAARAKAAFLAAMSHELRTPMNGVLGMLQLLQNTALSPDQQEYLSTAQVSGETLLHLIDDILDLSKIEAGRLELVNAPFPLWATVEDCAQMVAERAASKGLDLIVDIDPATPTHVEGDVHRLQQVLLNLLSNAVKFTARGRVRIVVVPAGDRVRFEVSDTGIGLSDEERSRLFQPFAQAHAGISKRFGGTGLGLAISRQLVGLMSGEIGIDSQPGEGSTFWFTARLPAGPIDPAFRLQRAAVAGKRVLCIDGHSESARIIARTLDWCGAIALCVSTVEEGLRACAEARADRPFSVAIVDAHAVATASADALAQLGAESQHGVKFVLLAEDALKAALPFVRTVLRKPARVAALLATVATLGSEEAHGQTAARGPALPPDVATRQGRVLVVDDNGINRRVAERMLTQLGYDVDLAEDGETAVALASKADYLAILMDRQMPGIDGIEATRRIRTACGPALRILGLTASADDATRRECLEAGMDDVLVKPFRRDALISLLTPRSEVA